ncbi:MAG TPA: DUF1329 domain-containing protein, partial [Candidatus Binataceae bacterium]|nr:DUF1329 domain-containing protein [Candidatus Binataceae bacterium]
MRPGDIVTAQQARRIKGLVAPGVYYKVANGMSMKIVPTSRVEWPPPYREATEKYSEQVRLSPDGRTVLNYVAGQPFPFLDPNDPQVATKIIWNNVFRPITSDDYDLRYFACENMYTGLNRPYRVIDEIDVGHYAGYNEIGRTEVEPMPIDPDFKRTGRYWLFALYPIMSPENMRGAGFVRYRYANPRKGDDIWSWNTGTRRLRRLDEPEMSDAVTGAGLPNEGGGNIVVFDPNHYSGFNAKVEEYNYRFLGEKNLLGVVHAAHSPEITCATDGGGSACPENWEMRHMYVVEATPRKGHNELQSKTILYIDGEIWYPLYEDEYDLRGQLWQNHIYWLTYRDRPVPDARVAIYPFKRAFVV